MTPAPPPSFTKKYTLLGPEITMTHDRGENFPEMLHVRGVSYGQGLDCWVRQQCKTGEIFFFLNFFLVTCSKIKKETTKLLFSERKNAQAGACNFRLY